MDRLSKFADINALLNKAKIQITVIEENYSGSLHEKDISADLLIEIKNYLGNLRSSLDYLRHKFSKFNFPICSSEAEFEKSTSDLSEQMKVVLRKCQPYNDNEWFAWFSILNNNSKHITLVPQKRRETIETRVSHPQGGSISWTNGVTFSGGISVMGVPIDPNTQLPIPNNIVTTERITWVDFIFDNTSIPSLPNNISALPFLKDCFEKICGIISEIESAQASISNDK